MPAKKMTLKDILERLELLHSQTTLSLQLSDPKKYQQLIKEINKLQRKITNL
jgi:hypothetical protein